MYIMNKLNATYVSPLYLKLLQLYMPTLGSVHMHLSTYTLEIEYSYVSNFLNVCVCTFSILSTTSWIIPRTFPSCDIERRRVSMAT